MMHYKHLSYASSLCGKCTEVCPVNIDLHFQLLQNRNFSVENKLAPPIENWGMRIWKMAMLKPKYMTFPGAGIKNFFLKKAFKKTWGNRRDLPVIQKKTFRELWKER
jgi:L-lactate dehydrogenase complex protein LldF